jgi:hypothetical protein
MNPCSLLETVQLRIHLEFRAALGSYDIEIRAREKIAVPIIQIQSILESKYYSLQGFDHMHPSLRPQMPVDVAVEIGCMINVALSPFFQSGQVWCAESYQTVIDKYNRLIKGGIV